MKKILTALSIPDLLKWANIFDSYLFAACKEKIRAIDFIVNAKDDDDPSDLVVWLIFKGREIYLNTLQFPDSICEIISVITAEIPAVKSDLIDKIVDDLFFDKMAITSDADLLYRERTRYELSNEEELALLAEIKFDSEIDDHWDEGNVSVVMPKLCEKFGWKDRDVIEIDLFNFFATGKFDYIKPGQTKEWLRYNFPIKVFDSDMGNQMSIWQFGNMELHFDKDMLFMIFCDYLSDISAGRKIRLHKWILEDIDSCTLQFVIRKLNEKHLDFSLKHDQNLNSVTLMIQSSKVQLHFESLVNDDYEKITENPNDYQLGGFWLSHADYTRAW